MTTVDMTADLQRIRLVSTKLARHCLTVDQDASVLAAQLAGLAATLCHRVEAEYGPLPQMSDMGAGLEVPLNLLDTPANRRLLEALREAHEAAIAVDRERGYGQDGPAQDLEDMVAKTKTEIYGAEGRGWE